MLRARVEKSADESSVVKFSLILPYHTILYFDTGKGYDFMETKVAK